MPFQVPWLLVGAWILSASAAAAAAGEPEFTTTAPKDLGLEWVAPKKDPKTGFLVGGKNETALIRTLTEIQERTIADLERDMRPGAKSEVGSRLGFLGPKESLLDVLATDNDVVVGQWRLTHQELARHLHLVGAIVAKNAKAGEKEGFTFRYHGRRFQGTFSASRGFQHSPFYDGTKTNTNVAVTNLTNGKKLEYSLLVPHMIERYGFYEGKGTPYRVDPLAVAAVFDFLAVKKSP